MVALDQLKHYLLVSLRSFAKYKSSFFINLLGLSTGITCALLIFFWIQSELSMNKFHEKDAQLYQILENRVFADRTITAESTSAPLAETLKAEFPEVETAVTIGPSSRFAKTVLSVGDKKIRGAVQYASKDYFRAFSYQSLEGKITTALHSPTSIVLSEAFAISLFQSPALAIGKQVILHDGQPQPYQVSAVIKTPPNSSESFDVILPFDILAKKWPNIMEWGNTAPNTYVVLKKGTNIDQFNKEIADLVKRKSDLTHRSLLAVHYSDFYLHGKYENGVQTGGRIEYVRLLGIIALFILLIACINFMNLATARASYRIKEIGVKKAVGASQQALSAQFLTESFLMTSLAFILAIGFVFLFIQPFSELTGKQLHLRFDLKQCGFMLGVVLLVSLLAGSYPALYLSQLKVLQTLKGKLQNPVGEVIARKGLVVFQFTLSVVLIISVLVVYKQLNYLQTVNLGYQKDQVITFEMDGNTALPTIIDRIKALPDVQNASAMDHQLTGHRSGTKGLDWEGKDPNSGTEFENMPVYNELLETLGIEMEGGRFFSSSFPADSSKIIFNEAAINFMGLEDPVGKMIRLWDEDRQIIGVVKDFHFESLHEKVKPLFMLLSDDPSTLVVKIKAGKEKQAIQCLTKLYQEINPGVPFDYQFMDKAYAAQYQAETRISVLARYFSALAILISCLGLFGLASFTAERRRKEVSIRKVLGASVANLGILLSREYIGLVGIAICIAFPIGWYLVNGWLDSFAYHINVSWWVFLLAGISALFITLITVSFQAINAALANPVKSLRSE